MAILAEDFVHVVGVDTHAQTHTAAVVDRTGAVRAEFSDTTDPAGLERLVEAARGAAREALSRAHLASPRARGAREALRVLLATRRASVAARSAAICQLKALVVTAPSALRQSL